MTIKMEADDQFMFYSENVGVDSGTVSSSNKEIKFQHVVAGTSCVVDAGGNIKTVAAGTYTFSFNSSTEQLTVTFAAPAEAQ